MIDIEKLKVGDYVTSDKSSNMYEVLDINFGDCIFIWSTEIGRGLHYFWDDKEYFNYFITHYTKDGDNGNEKTS